MRKRKMGIGIIAGLLSLAMVVTMLPSSTMTVHAEGELDNLVMNKEVWLEDDGTYTVQLDAYAKGQVTTETVKKVVPSDIILVLDQSGSMVNKTITGIPSNTFSEVSGITNAALAAGAYYYKVDDEYYRVTATKETISNVVTWVGEDGKSYTDDQISYTWMDSMKREYTPATPYVTASLSTWTRTHQTAVFINTFWYVNDTTNKESSHRINAKDARTAFSDEYDDDSHTVEFHNDGAPAAGDTDADDPYYVAAVYTAVTKQEVKTYRYTYTYTDANGKDIVIGQSSVGTETEVDSATCSVSPLYQRDTREGTRLEALEYAANEFIESIRTSAVKNNVDHRVAVVGFASDDYGSSSNSYYYSNTELFVGDTQYNYALSGKESTYNTEGNLASNHYGDAFQSVLTKDGYNNLQASIDELAGYGGTHPSLGFEMANGIFAANDTTETRAKIIIFLTDGEPGDSGFDSTEASTTYTQAKISKDTYGAKVYTVAVLQSKDDVTTDIDTFLKTTSSSGDYTLATSTSDLDDFFQTVDADINNTTTTVELSADSIVLDRFSDYFVAPDGFSIEDNVTVQVAKHAGYDAFAEATNAPSGVIASLSMSSDGNSVRGVSVSGFNFVSNENLVTTDDSGGSIVATGNKLIVTITGLLAKDEAATNTYIDTNADVSGIWDTDTDDNYGMVKAFNMPSTMITKKSYVLDYAKKAELDAFATTASRVDDDGDALFSEVNGNNTALTEKYGKVEVTDGKLTFTPSTTKWSGFDTFYALGKDSEVGDPKTKNIWSKVNVIPANNVYYEDDFVSNTTTGTVGIEYSGDWEVTASAGNKETANTEIHGGWQNEDLADDATYSDGSVHESSTKGATATFTFTGRGVDVYSRTNLSTGLVKAQLYEGEQTTAAALTQVLTVDNKAASGDYYQIPTVSFSELDYGTYTVKLTVLPTGTGDDARSTYYLDGIRVYNPLTEENEYSDTVMDAYGDEIGAMFTEVRDILIEARSFDAGTSDTTDGVVFIDELEGTGTNGTTTNVIGTYTKYGPKNEVYLAKDQAIAFYVGSSTTGKLCVGIKAPEGKTTASVTNGKGTSELNINTASDLYYEIVPNDGLVLVKNTGDNLLAISKLKMTGSMAVENVSVMSLLSYADEFDTLPVVAYSAPVVEEDVPDVDTGTEDNIGDIEINNSDDDYEQLVNDIKMWITNTFNSLRNWFNW